MTSFKNSEEGQDPKILASRFLEKGLASHVFPNADLLVSQHGKIIFEKYVGKTNARYYDLASLTKPLCTAFLFMLAVQNSDIKLDDPLSYYFITKNLKDVTIRELLNHTSGLVDWVDYFRANKQCRPDKYDGMSTVRLRRMPLQDILNNPKCLRKNKETLYSDLGYIVLGALLERKYRKSLDEIFNDKIAKPLKLTNELFFVPLKKKREHKKSVFYPSEICQRRHKKIQGEVMDENAWVMGGIAGHAGLFGTVKGVQRILSEWRLAQKGKSKLITKKTFHEFCQPDKKRKWGARSFTLGFDTPTKGKSQSGRYFSKNSIGHLGYSGTSFWWDLDKDFWIILLTNRCYPSRDNKKISEFRPKLHDTVITNLEFTQQVFYGKLTFP